MNERKTIKVLEINENGLHVVCIKDMTTNLNPYKLYKVWWDMGDHRKLIVKYQDFESVLWHIAQMTILDRSKWATIDR